jgi:hypothetical protein
MADEFDLSGLKGALGIAEKPSKQSTVNLKSLDPELAEKLAQAQAAYRQQYGKELPITSGFRDMEQQRKAAGGKYPAAEPGFSSHQYGKAIDISKDVPDSFLNQFGLHRSLGQKDIVHVELMPANKQPAAATESSDFDIGGLRSALLGEKPTKQAAPEPVQQAVAPIRPVIKPAAGKMATPEPAYSMEGIPLEAAVEPTGAAKTISDVATKAAGAPLGFMAGVAEPIANTYNSIQQLVGKYFPGLSEEQRTAISQDAMRNIQTTKEVLTPLKGVSPAVGTFGEVTGFMVNPANKLVPGFGGPATTLTGSVVKGGAQGAIANPVVTPVTEEEKPFLTEKINQGLTGSVGGAAFSGGLKLLGDALSKGVNAARSKFGGMAPEGEMNAVTTKILTDSGLDPNKVPTEFFNSLKDQAATALKTGDVKSFKQFVSNYSEANSLPVPVPMLRGQLTRDPMQYAVEQNLRGVQNVGEPIQKVLREQNTALLSNLDSFGASRGQAITESGHFLRNTLKKADEVEAQKVRDAYTAFKNSTGKDLDVPLTGLAQDYAKVLKDYGKDQIPQGVRNNLDSLGLLKGKQMKVTTIEDAENLIKVINRNYDPSKQPKGTINALDDLRRSIENSIKGAGAGESGQAGQLAQAARKAAKERFDTIADIPALRDTMKGKEPDKFLQNHILQGNVDQISKLRDYLAKSSPETLTQLQNDVMRVIKNRVTNNVSGENAKFSHAGLKDFLSDASASRLKTFLTPEQFQGLKQLNRVAENALYEPVSAAVNKSNTASAAANLVQGTVKSGAVNELLTNLAGIKFPGVAWGANAMRQMNQQARAGELIEQAVTPTAKPAGAPLRTLLKPGIPGAGLTQQEIDRRNREFERANR